MSIDPDGVKTPFLVNIGWLPLLWYIVCVGFAVPVHYAFLPSSVPSQRQFSENIRHGVPITLLKGPRKVIVMGLMGGSRSRITPHVCSMSWGLASGVGLLRHIAGPMLLLSKLKCIE